jgi:hypothetical protein
MAKKLTQAQIKADIAEFIELMGGYAVVVNVAGIPIKGKPEVYRKNPEMSGIGDVVSCIKSLHIQFEVKSSEDEPLRVAQEEHKYRLERAQGRYYQVTSLDDVIEILKVMGVC